MIASQNGKHTLAVDQDMYKLFLYDNVHKVRIKLINLDPKAQDLTDSDS